MAKNAFDKFKVGQRVIPSRKAVQANFRWRAPKPITGVVRRIDASYPYWTVHVQIVGQKRVGGYHMDFWEPWTKENTARYQWACRLCKQSGSSTIPATLDVWSGMQATKAAHRAKSRRCRGGLDTIRVWFPSEKKRAATKARKRSGR